MEKRSEIFKHGKDASKSQVFLASLSTLFDIAECQCKEYSIFFFFYPKEDRFSPQGQAFLTNQRTFCKMHLGAIDKKKKIQRSGEMDSKRN